MLHDPVHPGPVRAAVHGHAPVAHLVRGKAHVPAAVAPVVLVPPVQAEGSRAAVVQDAEQEQPVRLVAAAQRARLGSRSARSGKNLSCVRPRQLAV